MSYVDEILQRVISQNPAQPEFHQAVSEVLESLRPVIQRDEEKYRKEALLERLTTPDRIIAFRVTWVDARGQVQVDGMEWAARSTTGSHIPAGAVVKVDKIEGVKVFVSLAEEPAKV